MFFKDVYKQISNVYNLVIVMLWRHPENVELENVKVVHYCAGGSKPWRYTGEEENMEREDIQMLVKKWWDIYNDDTLNYKNTTAGAGDNEAESGRFKAGIRQDGPIKFITAPSAA